MYLFGKINVTPRLPERISGLSVLSNNLWWSWNSYSLRLFEYIDPILFNKVNKNPVKFLSEINQQKLLNVLNDSEFLKEYDNLSFFIENGEYDMLPNVVRMTNTCLKYGLILNDTQQTIKDFTLFPKEYFCPIWDNKLIIKEKSLEF